MGRGYVYLNILIWISAMIPLHQKALFGSLDWIMGTRSVRKLPVHILILFFVSAIDTSIHKLGKHPGTQLKNRLPITPLTHSFPFRDALRDARLIAKTSALPSFPFPSFNQLQSQ